MKKLLLILSFILLCGCSPNKPAQIITENNISIETTYGENMTVSRALAAKMLCLIFFPDENPTTNHFSDISEKDWYYKYANIMFEKNIMVGNEGLFSPIEPITYIEGMKAVKRLGGNDVKYNSKDAATAIGYNAWLKMIISLAEKKNIELTKSTLNIFSIGDGENSKLMTVCTDKGIYDYSGLGMESCVDKEISVCVKNNDIAYIENITSQTGTFKNIEIKKTENSVSAELFGIKRTFECTLPFSNGKHDITTENGKIIEIH